MQFFCIIYFSYQALRTLYAQSLSFWLWSNLSVQVTDKCIIFNVTVCFSDNDIYQRGAIMPNPGPCEECKCEPPSIVCQMIKCPVNSGCRTIQRANHCCPDYKCGKYIQLFLKLICLLLAPVTWSESESWTYLSNVHFALWQWTADQSGSRVERPTLQKHRLVSHLHMQAGVVCWSCFVLNYYCPKLQSCLCRPRQIESLSEAFSAESPFSL